MSIILFYVDRYLPIQLSINVIKALLFVGLVNSIALILVAFWLLHPILKGSVRSVVWGSLIILMLHNFIWTMVKLDSPVYVDEEIVKVDALDKKRITLIQYADFGVFGDSFRKVQVYELTSFLGIIEQEENI